MKDRSKLTKRQMEVARLVADGAKSKAIALKFGISDRTVEDHRRAINEHCRALLNAQLRAVAGSESTSKQVIDVRDGAAVLVHYLVTIDTIQLKFKPVTNEPSVQSILSQREFQVLLLLTSGYTNKEVGARLRPSIGVRTVETYHARIYTKLSQTFSLELGSIAHLTHFALSRNLITNLFVFLVKKSSTA